MWRNVLKKEDADTPRWEREDFHPLDSGHILMENLPRSIASYIHNPSDYNSEVVTGNETFTFDEEESTKIVHAVYRGEILDDVVKECKDHLSALLHTTIFSRLENLQKAPMNKILDDTVRPIVARYIGRMLGVFFADFTPIRNEGILASGKLRINDKVTVNTIVYGDYLQGIKDMIDAEAKVVVNDIRSDRYKRGKYGTESMRLVGEARIQEKEEEGSNRKIYSSRQPKTVPMTNTTRWDGPSVDGSRKVTVPVRAKFNPQTDAGTGIFFSTNLDKFRRYSHQNLIDDINDLIDSAMRVGYQQQSVKTTFDDTIKIVEYILDEKNIIKELSEGEQLPKELFTYGAQMREVAGKKPEEIMERLPDYTKRNLEIEDGTGPSVDGYTVSVNDKEYFTMYFSLKFGIKDRNKHMGIKGVSKRLSPDYVAEAPNNIYYNSRLFYGATSPQKPDGMIGLVRFTRGVPEGQKILQNIIHRLELTPPREKKFIMPHDLIGHGLLEQTINDADPSMGASWEYSPINERHFVKITNEIPLPEGWPLERFYQEIKTNPINAAGAVSVAIENDTMTKLSFTYYLDVAGAERARYQKKIVHLRDTEWEHGTSAHYTPDRQGTHLCIFTNINRVIHESQSGETCIVMPSAEVPLADFAVSFIYAANMFYNFMKGPFEIGDVDISEDYITVEDFKNIRQMLNDSSQFGSDIRTMSTMMEMTFKIIRRVGTRTKLNIKRSEQNVGENNKDTV